MHIVINQLSNKYWVFIFSWSAVLAFVMLGWVIWQGYIFVINSDFEGSKVSVNGDGIVALFTLTFALIALAMWGASWGVDCYTSSPYCKEKWNREWYGRSRT